MSAIVSGLIGGFEKNRDYGLRLVSDLTDQQMLAQPDGQRDKPVNHPAWVFSHLNVYLPIVQAVIQGQTFDDPKDHQFGMQSKPEFDASIYASKESLVADWTRLHDQAIEAFSGCGNEVFEQAVVLPRWAEVMPTAGILLPYLMLNHENIHLGQISAWRRVLGLPSV